MSDDSGKMTVSQTIAAVAVILDVPADEIEGYVVIGVKADGEYLVTSNASSMEQCAGTLADAAAQTMYRLAEQRTVIVLT